MNVTWNKKFVVLFERWSYKFSLVCYLLFFLMIWMLSVPLKSHVRYDVPSINFASNKKIEDTFEIKLKNSNFNSDNIDNSEYLVNMNNNENIHKDQTDILMDVFNK